MKKIAPLLAALWLITPVSAMADEGGHAQDHALSSGLEGFQDTLNDVVGTYLVAPLASIMFYDVFFWDNGESGQSSRCADAGLSAEQCTSMMALEGDAEQQAFCVSTGVSEDACKDVPVDLNMPFIVLWLVLGAIFFTLRFNFINLRGFIHAIHVTKGDYDNEDDAGEVSHFQALSSALSATVGLGNIAGVAVAVGIGGPGAVFWMVIAGFLGMSSKFVECTLGQMYREVDSDGRVLGGPMRYLKIGLAERGQTGLGRVLAVMFAIMCIGGSFGGGNMFQSNQSYRQVASVVPALDSPAGAWIYGLVLALLVGIVIIGGIKRIGKVAGVVVPFMCGLYVLAGLWVLVTHAGQVPAAFGSIVGEAFSPAAGMGGLVGVLVQGFKRAAFSNEAGTGSASIAHSAAATDEPVREGIVALLEPFVDTIVVCTMTGLVIVISGSYLEPGEGIEMTSRAFAGTISWFPIVLSFAVFMFAFSTMISWSYYGERCWTSLFGSGRAAAMIYRILFLMFVVVGAVTELGAVIDFSDLMILGMAFPNILGLFLLSGRVRAALDDYWSRLQSGEMKRNGH